MDVVRLLVQHVRRAGRGDQDAVGAGGEPAAAPQRPDSEPGGNDQGHRAAGAGRVRPDRRIARQAGRRADAASRRSQAANEQSSALARLLVVVENYPQLRSNETFNRLMDELVGHGKPHRRRADAVQRARAGVQHVAAAVPVEHHRRHLRLQANTRCSTRRRKPSACRSGLRRQASEAKERLMALVDALLPEFDHEMTHAPASCSSGCRTTSSTGSRTRSRCRSASLPSTSRRSRCGAA